MNPIWMCQTTDIMHLQRAEIVELVLDAGDVDVMTKLRLLSRNVKSLVAPRFEFDVVDRQHGGRAVKASEKAMRHMGAYAREEVIEIFLADVGRCLKVTEENINQVLCGAAWAKRVKVVERLLPHVKRVSEVAVKMALSGGDMQVIEMIDKHAQDASGGPICLFRCSLLEWAARYTQDVELFRGLLSRFAESVGSLSEILEVTFWYDKFDFASILMREYDVYPSADMVAIAVGRTTRLADMIQLLGPRFRRMMNTLRASIMTAAANGDVHKVLAMQERNPDDKSGVALVACNAAIQAGQVGVVRRFIGEVPCISKISVPSVEVLVFITLAALQGGEMLDVVMSAMPMQSPVRPDVVDRRYMARALLKEDVLINFTTVAFSDLKPDAVVRMLAIANAMGVVVVDPADVLDKAAREGLVETVEAILDTMEAVPRDDYMRTAINMRNRKFLGHLYFHMTE